MPARRTAGRASQVTCNADEGEPGTFKDRELLMRFADGVLEGKTVAAFAVGATRGFLYPRAEDPFLVEPLRGKLDEHRAAGPARQHNSAYCGPKATPQAILFERSCVRQEADVLFRALQAEPFGRSDYSGCGSWN